MTQSIAHRNHMYLNSTPYDLTQKRGEFMVKLRKKKRFNNFQKHRESNSHSYSESRTIDSDSLHKNIYLVNRSWLQNLSNISPGSPSSEILEVLEHLTKAISSENSALSLLVSSDSLLSLIPLSNHSDPEIKYEIFKILTSLSTINSQELIDNLPDPIFSRILEYLDENSEEILVKTLKCLDAFISSDQRFFEVFQSAQVFPRLLKILKIFKGFEIFHFANCLCLSLSDYESFLSEFEILIFLDILMEILSFDEASIKNEGILTLGNLIRADSYKIELFMQHDLFKVVFDAIKTSELAENWVKTLGNLTSGTHQQTQILMDMGLLDIYLYLIEARTIKSISSVYFSLSNIAAGISYQLYEMVYHPVFKAALKNIEYLDEDGKVEASYLLRNVFKLGNSCLKNMIFILYVREVIPFLTNIKDPEGLFNILFVLEEILKLLGKQSFIEKGFYEIVEQIQVHKNHEIYKKCLSILNPLLTNLVY